MAVRSWEAKPCCLLLPITHLAKISGQRATLISQECIAGNIILKYPFGKATLKSSGWHIYFLSKQVYIILGRFRIKYRGHVNKTRWLSGKESAWNAGDSDLISGSGRSPGLRREWQPTPVFSHGKFHEQRSLASYSPWGRKRVGHDFSTKQQILRLH